MDGAGELTAMAVRHLRCLSVIGLSQLHAPGRCAQHKRQRIRAVPAGFMPGLARRQQQQHPRPVQARDLAGSETGRLQRRRQINLRRHLRPLAADIEQRHRPERRAARAESGGVRHPPDAERRHNASAGDDNTGDR